MSSTKRIAVVGGINMDIQARSHEFFRPGDSNPGFVTRNPGGVGRNIAENLVRLGLEVELVTVIGDDAVSTELEASCGAFGIGTAGFFRIAGRPAPHYVCLLDADGRLAGAVASMEIFDELLPGRLSERKAILDAADLIVVDANVPETSIAWLAETYGRRAGSERESRLVLDPVSAIKARRARATLGAFNFAKPNLAEAAVLAGIGTADPVADASSVRSLAGALRSTGLGQVFVSLAAEGVFVDGIEGIDCSSILRGFARPPATFPPGLETKNVSGAGDAACAALVWGFIEDFDLETRARLSVSAAMLAAASESTVSPDMDGDRLFDIAKGVTFEPLP